MNKIFLYTFFLLFSISVKSQPNIFRTAQYFDFAKDMPICEYKGALLGIKTDIDTTAGFKKHYSYIYTTSLDSAKVTRRTLFWADTMGEEAFFTRYNSGIIYNGKDRIAITTINLYPNHWENQYLRRSDKARLMVSILDTNFNLLSQQFIDSNNYLDKYESFQYPSLYNLGDKLVILNGRSRYDTTNILKCQGSKFKTTLIDFNGNVIQSSSLDPTGYWNTSETLSLTKPDLFDINATVSADNKLLQITLPAFRITGQHKDSGSIYNSRFYTCIYDSNLNLIKISNKIIRENTGQKLKWNGGNCPRVIILPDTTLIADMFYTINNVTNKYLMRVWPIENNKPNKLSILSYSSPFSGPIDDDVLLQNIDYNKNSNTIYRISHVQGSYVDVRCNTAWGFIPNFWHITAFDTLLNVLWFKHIFSGNDSCLNSRVITASKFSNGVYIQGMKQDSSIVPKGYMPMLWFVDSLYVPNSIKNNFLSNNRYIVSSTVPTNFITVLDEGNENFNFKIMDLNGKILSCGRSYLGYQYLDVSFLNMGIYFLKLNSINNKGEPKIVKFFKQ